MDNAATTALNKEVLDAMMPYLTDIYGNPSSLHTFGQEAHKAVADAREKVARALNAADAEKEIIFTGCGTESDNMVLRGIAERLSKKGKHIITTAVEHHAVLYTCRYLEKQGFEVTYLPVDEFGRVTAEQVREAIRPDTILVSVMFGNNEIGTLMPIAEIGAICRERGVLFHTDAVQAVGPVTSFAVGAVSSTAPNRSGKRSFIPSSASIYPRMPSRVFLVSSKYASASGLLFCHSGKALDLPAKTSCAISLNSALLGA